MFETTIRYLAGSLSAFELSGKKFPILVEKAKEVADKMSVAWVGVRHPKDKDESTLIGLNSQSNKVPFGEVDFNTSSPQIATVSDAASSCSYSCC